MIHIYEWEERIITYFVVRIILFGCTSQCGFWGLVGLPAMKDAGHVVR
jgi:hypothetical protein